MYEYVKIQCFVDVCTINLDIEIDFIEESQENMNDELLISIVRDNAVLYEKTLKDYKNKELKLDIWESIGDAQLYRLSIAFFEIDKII